MGGKKSVAESVREYLSQRHCIRDCIVLGLINNSSLSRVICRELRIRNSAAVHSALRRYSRKVRNEVASLDNSINSIIANSSISMRSDVAVVTIPVDANWREVDRKFALFHVIEGDGVTNLIMDSKELPRLNNLGFETIKVRPNLSAITINSPPEIVSVPGVTIRLLEPLSFNGINIQEYMSCYTSKIILLKREDASRAYELLEKLIETTRTKNSFGKANEETP